MFCHSNQIGHVSTLVSLIICSNYSNTLSAYQNVHAVQKLNSQVTSPMKNINICLAGVKKTCTLCKSSRPNTVLTQSYGLSQLYVSSLGGTFIIPVAQAELLHQFIGRNVMVVIDFFLHFPCYVLYLFRRHNGKILFISL